LSLSDVGLVLQLIGVVMSAAGFWRTWREFAGTTDRFFEPMTGSLVHGVRAVRTAATQSLQRIGLIRSKNVRAEVCEFLQTQAFDARARVQYGDGAPLIFSEQPGARFATPGG